MTKRLLAWWRARRAERAARCGWCAEYRLPGQAEACTWEGLRVHADCLDAANDDAVEAAAW